MQAILENEKRDWIYIIGSSLAGFILVATYFFLKDVVKLPIETSFFIVFIIFSVLFDDRHFFSTYSRTFFDKSFTKSNKKWFVRSWLFIILLPILAAVSLSSAEFFAFDSTMILSITARIATVLGFYHLVKQNWGFMAIYKKKFNEPENGSDRWEKLLLLSGSFFALAYFSKNHPVWFPGDEMAFNPLPNQLEYIVALWKKVGVFCLFLGGLFLLVGFVFKSAPEYKFVSRNLGYFFTGIFIFIQLILANSFQSVMQVVLIFLVILFVVSLIMTVLKARGQVFNTKKWLVLVSSLVLYNGIMLIPVDYNYLLVMGITLPHDIQYLKFVNFFNRKHYEKAENSIGLSKRLSQKVAFFFVVSLIYALVFEGFRSGMRMAPLDGFGDTAFIIRNFVLLFFVSMVLHHYYLDAVIWRVRKDKELSKEI
jgi:hypothetical protein